MAVNLKYAASLRTTRLNADNTAVGASAIIRLYDGAQPAGPDTAVTSQNVLGTWTGNASAFGAVSGNVLTANTVANTVATVTGTAAWFRILTSGGVAIIDGSAGTSASDMTLPTTSIASGVTLQFTSLTITGGNA